VEKRLRTSALAFTLPAEYFNQSLKN